MIKKIFTLRNTMTYLIYAIVLGIAYTYLNLNISNLSMMAVLFLDVILSLALIFVACAIVCFVSNTRIRNCATHAIILTIVYFSIANIASSFIQTDAIDTPNMGSDVTDDMDWLDRQAYEAMLEEGLIEEGEKIYGEPYIGESADLPDNGDGNASTEDNGIAYSDWDVQIVEPSISDKILNVVLTFIVGFLGGIGGLGFKKRRLKALIKEH